MTANRTRVITLLVVSSVSPLGLPCPASQVDSPTPNQPTPTSNTDAPAPKPGTPNEQNRATQLEQKADQLDRDLALLRQKRDALASRLSQEAVAAFDQEIKSTQVRAQALRAAAKIEADINDLQGLLDRMRDRASGDFLASLQTEIDKKKDQETRQLDAARVADFPDDSGGTSGKPDTQKPSSGDRLQKPIGSNITVEGCILNPLETLNQPDLRLGAHCTPEWWGDSSPIGGALTSRDEGATQQGTPVKSRQAQAQDEIKGWAEKLRASSRSARNIDSCSAYDFFRDCTVKLTRNDKTVAEAQTDHNGYFRITFAENQQESTTGESANGPNDPPSGQAANNGKAELPLLLATEADNRTLQREVKLSPGQSVYRMDLPLENRPVSLLSRAIVGYDQAGATSVKSAQRFFFDLFVSVPFPWEKDKTKYPCDPKTGKRCIDPDFGPTNRIWGDAQVSSVPQSGTTPLGSFVTGAGFAGEASKLEVGKVAQSVQFLVGAEIRLPRVFSFRTLLPSFDHNTKQKFTISLIGAFGAITPTNPQEAVQLFKYQPDSGLPEVPPGTEFVAFVPPARDRFYRQYYAGFRFQTLFFNRFDRPLQRFPAMLDIMYGQNEFITRGHFRGGLFRFDAYYPLPYENLKFVNLFGTFFFRPTREHDTSPLILELAPAGTTFPASNVARIEAPQVNRDYYRIGIGIDFVSFTQLLLKTAQPKVGE